MLKYKFIFYMILSLIIIGFLYPLINNEKTISLDDDIVALRPTTITNNDTTISYSITCSDSTIYPIHKNVVSEVKTIINSHRDNNFVGIFDKDNKTIRKVYHSEYKEFVFFFRFNREVYFFPDRQDNNFLPFIILIVLVTIVFGIMIFIMYENGDRDQAIFTISVTILNFMIASYLYTTFETGWVGLILLFIYIIIILKIDDIETKYNDTHYAHNHIKEKTNHLTENYNKLLK